MGVLKYLKENPEISEMSDFNKIKNMKYMDILSAYFSSREFEQTIIELYHKKETNDYIKEYVNKAISYVNFFIIKEKMRQQALIKIIILLQKMMMMMMKNWKMKVKFN